MLSADDKYQKLAINTGASNGIRPDDEVRAFGSASSIAENLGGYHMCCLEEPVHLEFVSENFCEMLGFKRTELLAFVDNTYTCLVHPDDTTLFEEFISRLAIGEGCESVVYRLIKKDGTIIRVVDTMASVIGRDGKMRGYSVVSEILDEQLAAKPTAPGEKIAVLKVAGDPSGHIEFMCGTAQELLAVGEVSDKLNLMDFVMLRDRAAVRGSIERAYANEFSGMESRSLVSADGRLLKCDLWVECVHKGERIDISSFVVKAEIEDEHQREGEEVISFSQQLFSSFHENVFEIDRVEKTIKLICRSETAHINVPLNVRMNVDEFLEYFVAHVAAADAGISREFCVRARAGLIDGEQVEQRRIHFQMTNSEGNRNAYALTMVPVSAAKYFLCLRLDSDIAGHNASFSSVMTRKHITVTLFGSFSITVDGVAVHIRNDKARELLALLIERRGSFLTTREAVSELWECETNEKVRARYRKLASRLMAELRRVGIDYIVESDRGARRVIPEYIDCDYYDYRDGLIEPSGAFLPEYSWSEFVRVD